MKSLFIRSVQVRLLALLALPALLLSACVQDGETIEGTLRAIDCIDGQITVVTDEGRTVVMTIETPDCEAEDLREGQKVRVQTDEDVRVVHQVTVIEQTVVQETTVVGKIVNVQADRVIVRKDTGEEVTVRIEPDKTKVEANGEAEPTVQHLRQDVTVVINIDQQTNVAQTIKIENGAEAAPEASPTPEAGPSPTPEAEPSPTPAMTTVKGVVTSVSATSVSIRTEDGGDLTLDIVAETKVESALGAEAMLSEGDEVTVEFDTQSQVALEIEIQADSQSSGS
jgi:hypothetical protein